MNLLIDADLVAYRCAASVGINGEEEIALLRCDSLMRNLLHYTDATSYIGFLTGHNNFRRLVNKDYKANRKDLVRPEWLESCRKFLIEDWKCHVTDGVEADDMLGIHQNDKSCIASLDKDMLMIPGKHYNWQKEEFTTVTEDEGLRHFYKQLLIGDRVDNIFGVTGIGKVKASKYIDSLDNEQDYLNACITLYNGDFTRLLSNAQCLWIMRKEGETWANRIQHLILPKEFKQETEAMSNSMKFLTVDTSMEPTMTPIQTFGIPVNGIVAESMEAITVPLT